MYAHCSPDRDAIVTKIILFLSLSDLLTVNDPFKPVPKQPGNQLYTLDQNLKLAGLHTYMYLYMYLYTSLQMADSI